MSHLTPDQINLRLVQLPGWEVRDGFLTKTYTVRSFVHGVLFVGAIGQLAEAANHHPDVNLHGYSHVTVSLVTHSEGGLTANDFELATKIEELPHKPLKAKAEPS
jgi:4a-hydroxytetrahydrobiopterin dehydratase